MPDDLTLILFRLHAAVTWFLVGLIWFVQVVHYPLMRSVGPGHFREYERFHQKRTSRVVAPAMLAELALSITLVIVAHRVGSGLIWSWIGLALVGLIWLSTFFVQIPLHTRLARGFNEAAWRALVLTNIARTLAWSLRGIIALVMLG